MTQWLVGCRIIDKLGSIYLKKLHCYYSIIVTFEIISIRKIKYNTDYLSKYKCVSISNGLYTI